MKYPQLAKEPLVTSKQRGNPENRVIAKAIDCAFGFFLQFALGFAGSTVTLVGTLFFWAFIDGVGKGQSPGKWLLGLHTVEVQKGTRVRFYQGLTRNFPFLMFFVALQLPSFYSYVLGVVALCAVIVESYFVFAVRSGIRVGDMIGNTRVSDYKDEHTKFIEQFLKEDAL